MTPKMTPNEIKLMEMNAELTLSIADSEGWTPQDGTRALANLAIRAAEEIRRLRAACELAHEYISGEYNDGTPGDPRPKKGDDEALDQVNVTLRTALGIQP